MVAFNEEPERHTKTDCDCWICQLKRKGIKVITGSITAQNEADGLPEMVITILTREQHAKNAHKYVRAYLDKVMGNYGAVIDLDENTISRDDMKRAIMLDLLEGTVYNTMKLAFAGKPEEAKIIEKCREVENIIKSYNKLPWFLKMFKKKPKPAEELAKTAANIFCPKEKNPC